jgi:hypothetical protein
MVVEELVFFAVVPICGLLTLEAVRAMHGRRVALDTEGERCASTP